jgi:creatinine amidohydrolase
MITRETRLEYLRPEQIDAAKAACPAIFVPFGSIEFHGRQNCVGLDTLKAHAQLVRLAQRAGGLVYPPVYFGTGGGHGDYPYSYMFSPADLLSLTTRMLHLFQRDGFERAILLSGHYPNYWDYLKPAIEAYRNEGGTMRVLALIEAQVPNVRGDHGALCETSFMLHLHPDTVDLARLAGHDQDISPTTQDRNWMTPGSESHPCYGLVGADPRNASASLGEQFTESLIAALAQWLQGQDLPRTWE